MGKRLAIPVAGFALYWLTDILSFHATTAFASLGGMSAELENVYFVTLAASRIAAYAVALLARRHSHEDGLPPVPAAAAATVTALLGIALVAGAVLQVNAELADAGAANGSGAASVGLWAAFTLGTALFGAAQGIMGLAWASRLPCSRIAAAIFT